VPKSVYDNGVVASTHADPHDVNVMEKLGQNQEPSAMDKLKTSASETVHAMSDKAQYLAASTKEKLHEATRPQPASQPTGPLQQGKV